MAGYLLELVQQRPPVLQLVLVFVDGRKLENPEKNPGSNVRTNNKLNPHMTPGWNETCTSLVGGECS